MRFFAAIVAFALVLTLWFRFAQDGSTAALSQRATDLLDSRPPKSILIVGNSRTYRNDMPGMLRAITDSAGSPAKFQVETSAFPAASLKAHWKNERTRRLLEAGWDEIILQPDSGAQMHPQYNAQFHEYGGKLATKAKVNEGRPRLVVGWTYDPQKYHDSSYNTVGLSHSEHLALVKAEHAQLAVDASLSRINLAGLWEAVRFSHPSIRLTTDGNHPTVAGSYLYALAVFACLSNGPVATVSYSPEGLGADDARKLRAAVDAFPVLS